MGGRASAAGGIEVAGADDAGTEVAGWAEQRLGVELVGVPGTPGADPADLPDLVGVAVRRNPRRAHLLVSTVLGKHQPTDPAVIRGAALRLGRLVGAELAVRGAAGSAPAAGSPIGDVLVIGYAETATALGHAVADALGADYLSSTRRVVRATAEAGAFEEEHSHATSHRLLPDDAGLLGAGTVVLVDDELTTGATALNTVAALERIRAGRRYVVAALVDLRAPADVATMRAVAVTSGIELAVVALAAGRIDVPPDVLARAAALLRDAADPPATAPSPTGAVEWLAGVWPAEVRLHGRHGFRHVDRERFEGALEALARAVAGRLRPGRIHVLGTEELMYLPQRLADRLAASIPGATVTSSATTRSPILVVDDPGYPIRSGLVFDAHDDPADGPADRFVYNLGAPGRFDAVVLVVDAGGVTPQLTGPAGLVTRLAGLAVRVLVVVVPDGVPGTGA